MSQQNNETITRTLTSLKCVMHSLQAFMTKNNGQSNGNKGAITPKHPFVMY